MRIRTEQQELEYEKAEAAIRSYREARAKYVKNQEETRQLPARILLRESLRDFTLALKAWLTDNQKGAGRRGSAYGVVSLMPPDRACFIAARVIFNRISSPSSFTRTASVIGKELEREIRAAHCKETNKGLWEFVCRDMGWGVSPARIDKYLQGQAKKDDNRLEAVSIPARDRHIAGALLLEIFLAVHSGEGGIVFEARTDQVKVNRKETLICASDQTIEWLEKSHGKHELLVPFHESCLIPPKPWTSMDEGGYHTEAGQGTFVRARYAGGTNLGPVGINRDNDLSEIFDAANAMQGAAFSVNEDILQTARHYWDLSSTIGDLPAREDLPLPSITEEQRKTPEGKMDWRNAFYRARSINLKNAGRRFQTLQTLMVGEGDRKKGRFFLPVTADFRFRLYPAHTGLTYQGGDLEKAMLKTADPYKLEDDEAEHWFNVHGANCWGLDKATFPERVEWVEKNRDAIAAVREDPIEAAGFWSSAADPWQFLAWALEAGDLWDVGREAFETRILVGQDCSCSGHQIFSLLLRDESGARATNVSPGVRRESLYRVVAERVGGRLAELAGEEKMARGWLTFLEGEVPLKMVKRVVMTVPYNLSKWSAMKYVAEAYREVCEDKRTEEFSGFFKGEGYPEIKFFNELLWECIGEVIPSAFKVMEWLKAAVQAVVDEGHEPYWRGPTGGLLYQGYRKEKSKKIKTTFGSSIRYGTLRQDTDEVDRQKMVNSVAPNFVHGFDAAIVHKSVNRLYDLGLRDLAVIHDDWRVPAPWAARMRDAVRGAAAEIFMEDWLLRFKQDMELFGVTVDDPPARGSLDPSVVLESPYFVS